MGGVDKPIILISKQPNRGLLYLFEKGTGLFHPSNPANSNPAKTIATWAWDAGANNNNIVWTGGLPDAISYISLGSALAHIANGMPIKIIALDGVFPSAESIANHSYPIDKCPIHLTVEDRKTRRVQETFIRKDGSQLPVSVTVAPLGKDKGVVVFQDMTTIKEEHDTLDRSANYDYLTQLPNRRLFMILAEQKIAESKRRKNLIAIAFLDLDGFKLVNDFHGHDIGDDLLEEVAKRFKATLRESDIVARFGGDEFVVLLDSPQSIDEVEETLKRIIQEISHPFHINDLSLQVGVSIGYTLFPEDESDINSLLKHADDAMYDAKQAGKGTLKRFQG